MQKIKTKMLVVSAVCVALGMVTSLIKIIDLPMGGSVTLFSMFFVSLAGHWYGPKMGILTAVVYGVLQFIINPYFLTVPQVLFDYVFAFGCLGLSGFFYRKKFGLQVGYLVSVFGRFVFSTLSGLLFFAEYAEGSGYSALVYTILYNGAYIGLEAAITLVLIFIPPVSKAIAHVGREVQ